MKRVGLLIAAGMLVALLPATAASGGAGGDTANVSVLHGLGPAPATVDVYAGPEDATSWDLLIEDFEYGEVENLGDLEAGVVNVLICTAEVSPPPTPITSCPADEETDAGTELDAPAFAVNSNVGTNVELLAGTDITLVAAYGPPEGATVGRPTVLAFENDVSCVEEGEARVTAAHAATAPEVNVIADGTELFTDLAYSEAQDAVVPAGAYDLEVVLAADDSPVLERADSDLDALKLTVLYVVGNPQFQAEFDMIGIETDLEVCPADVPPPAVAPVSPVSPVAPATPSAPAPVSVATPALTG